MELKQVWFAGVHADIGGGYKPDTGGAILADIPLQWMINEAERSGLVCEQHLTSNLKGNHRAQQHEEYEGFFKVLGKHIRRIPKHTLIHKSVQQRYEAMPDYRPATLTRFIEKYGWCNLTE
jgi:hypothetical protein